jgi:hypothetical protein
MILDERVLLPDWFELARSWLTVSVFLTVALGWLWVLARMWEGNRTAYTWIAGTALVFGLAGFIGTVVRLCSSARYRRFILESPDVLLRAALDEKTLIAGLSLSGGLLAYVYLVVRGYRWTAARRSIEQ